MPTFGGIVGAACEDGTEAIGNVGVVDMLQGHNLGAAVKRAGGENAVAEWLTLHFLIIVVMFGLQTGCLR